MEEQWNNVTIDEVLEQLDKIIADASINNDPLGFFAYVYRRTTAQIKLALIDKKFEDNDRMAKFDVLFASKYLEAYRAFHSGLPVCAPWAIAFQVNKEKMTILQHIILGMNAHINYDLGMVAAEFTRGGEIGALKNDFMLVNEVLNHLVDELQVKVGRVSRLMFLLDLIGKRNDEAVINFSMEKARQQAWNFANVLAALPEQEQKIAIDKVDTVIGNLAEVVKHPPGKVLANVLKIIAFFEVKDVKKVIERLEAD